MYNFWKYTNSLEFSEDQDQHDQITSSEKSTGPTVANSVFPVDLEQPLWCAVHYYLSQCHPCAPWPMQRSIPPCALNAQLILPAYIDYWYFSQCVFLCFCLNKVFYAPKFCLTQDPRLGIYSNVKKYNLSNFPVLNVCNLNFITILTLNI